MKTQCEKIKEYLPEYINGELDPQMLSAVEEHLKSCDLCKKYCEELQSFLEHIGSFPEVETPAGMKEEFMEMAGINEKKTTKIFRLPIWTKVAASILIVAGTFATGFFSGSKSKEVKQLKVELSNTKQQVSLASLQDYSGPQRIQAVYNISSSGKANNNLVNALVHTMNCDKNENVRLAAINALAGMINKNENIKSELIKSLSIQKNPLLQISLIQVLTDSRVKEAKDEIESLSKEQGTNAQVKEYAKKVIQTII